MADISKEDLKKEIAAYLKGKDLATTSAKKVRTAIEKKLECDLTSRKKEVDEIVMACLKTSDKKAVKGKKNGNKDDDDEDGEEENGDEADEKEEVEEKEDEEEEDEEEEEEEEKPKRAAPKKAAPKRKKGSSDSEEGSDAEDKSDEEYSPKKKAKGAPKGKRGSKGKKKKGSDSDSDEDWKNSGKKAKKTGAKRGGGGGRFTKTCTLSPELAAVVGSDQMARHEVVKKVWEIIKSKNLYDPKNKQFAICDDQLMAVIGTKRFRTFGMMKYLKKHFVD